jgi:oxaloacetate decarboxylase alpha subunit
LQITPIEKIRLPLKSRDELPPILAGLQWIWMPPTLKAEIFALLEAKILAGKQATGRTGMDLWQILVLGVVRLGLDADWDRLEHVANDDALYRKLAEVIAACPDMDRAYIKDPAGLLTPDRARTLIPAVREGLAGKPLELHSHCNIGLAPYTYIVAAELGVAALHVALGPLANGSSLPSALQVTANLREHGHRVDVDDHAMATAADYFDRIAKAQGLPIGAPHDYDATFLRHQVAGGVMTTTRRQLEEVRLGHRFAEVMEEVDRVRAELGYPIMVTPFPQIVCTQALFNVIGTERYAQVPDQVIRYVLGKFGRPIAPVDQAVLDRILASPRAREIMAEPPPPSLAELRQRIGSHLSDDEFLLRATMPAEQVDAMVAAGPACIGYNPDTVPLFKLLAEAVRRTDLDYLRIEKPGLTLELSSGGAS